MFGSFKSETRYAGLARPARRIGGIVVAAALGASIALAAPLAASAETPSAGIPVSHAEGQFLSGNLAGIDVGTVAAIGAAIAKNTGNQALQVSRAGWLGSSDGLQLDLGSWLDAGAIQQYAQADRNGASMGASGAIGNDGTFGVGSVGNGSAGDLKVDLDGLLDAKYASILTDLRLSLDAVSARATAELTSASGEYRIAGANLTLTSPAIADLKGKVASALLVVDNSLLDLSSRDGELALAVGRILNPLIAPTGSGVTVDVTISHDIDAAVQSLLIDAYGNGAVRFNLQTGEVTIDLEALIGSNLNDLPPNTELLSGPVLTATLQSIANTVTSLADQIVARVTAELRNATVTVHAGLDVLTPQAGQQQTVCTDVQVPIIGDIVTGGILGGILGGLGTKTEQGIVGYTVNTVCDVVTSVLPSLHSTVAVDIRGTVGQLVNGTAAQADAAVSLLGGTVNANVNLEAVIGGLGKSLFGGLFGTGGSVSALTRALDGGLVGPAITGLMGPTSIDGILNDLLSVKVNVQELENGMFTETAVRVAVLGGEPATVNVAKATVGPNASTVTPTPGCTSNCGTSTPDPCVLFCGFELPTLSIAAGSGGNLAMTGFGIGTLIAIVLALLAAGAFLAREGYRQKKAATGTTSP